MEQLNNYIFNVFNMIKLVQENGLLVRPKELEIYWKDKKILYNIYNLYKVYTFGITKKQFIEMCKEYSINSNINIIKAGSELGEVLEKISK